MAQETAIKRRGEARVASTNNPSANINARDLQPTEEEQRRANEAVAALDDMQRLRLLEMLMNTRKWRREKKR